MKDVQKFVVSATVAGFVLFANASWSNIQSATPPTRLPTYILSQESVQNSADVFSKLSGKPAQAGQPIQTVAIFCVCTGFRDIPGPEGCGGNPQETLGFCCLGGMVCI